LTSWAKFAAISCTHCPYQSESAVDRLLRELEGRSLTHFVHCGDIVEGHAGSVHADDPVQHTLLDEFIVAADMLRRIRETLQKKNPDIVLVALDGNHDDNLQRAEGNRRIKPDLRELCNPRKMGGGVKEEFNQWKHVPYRFGLTYQLGAVIFHHGFAAGANSDEMEAIQIAMSCGGYSHRLVIRGHTHRPVAPTQCKRSSRVLLPWWFANCGYMAFDKRAEYTNRFSIDQWGRGMIVGETKIGRADRLPKDSWKAELIRLDA